ncbi:MAG: hypothetical protein AVDCRST_MAG67-4088, partial [uncultured Solirubrobacteraceae bacterium]
GVHQRTLERAETRRGDDRTPGARRQLRRGQRPLRKSRVAVRRGRATTARRRVQPHRHERITRQHAEDRPAVTPVVAEGRQLSRHGSRRSRADDRRQRDPVAHALALHLGALSRHGARRRQAADRRRLPGPARHGGGLQAQRAAAGGDRRRVGDERRAAGRRAAQRAAAGGDARVRRAQGRDGVVLPHRSGRQGPRHDLSPPQRPPRAALGRLLRHAEHRPGDPAQPPAQAAHDARVQKRARATRARARRDDGRDELHASRGHRPEPLPVRRDVVREPLQRLRGGDAAGRPV